MKKNIIIIFLLFFANLGYSAPVNNPLAPEIIEEGFFISPASWLNFRLGYEGNFVSDGRMNKSIGNEGRIDNFKQDVNSGTVTINFYNRMDAYAVLGASRIRSDWRYTYGGITSRVELETNYRFSWAVGGKAILFEWGNTAFSVGARYSFTKPTLSFVTKDGVPNDNSNNARVRYKDYQIDVDLGHKIDVFIPYIGGKYSVAKSSIKNFDFPVTQDGDTEMRMKNKDHFGVFVGCSLSNGKYFMLNVEARFIDEEGITVSGDLKF
ncbi:MAG: hypothetical protein JXA94_06450 [Parachlamydiales bacterium]|nr:hypothetical protein [Parachlamydiales bacterium]